MLGAHHHEIKHLRRLLGRRSARRDAGEFVVEGPIAVGEALASGARVRRVYADPATVDGTALDVGSVDVVVVGHDVLTSVLTTTTPQPVCAIVEIAETGVDEVLDRASATGCPVLVCSNVTDPGNVGTLVRAAHASGCAGVVLADDSVDLYNPKTVRSTAGSVFRLPVVNGAEGVDVVDAAARRSMPTWAAVTGDESSTSFTAVDLSGAAMLVVGNEAHGVPPAVVSACSGRLTIPMESTAESLNVAMAGTLLCFEGRRQRLERGGR